MASELGTEIVIEHCSSVDLLFELLLKLCSSNWFEFECLYFNLGAAAMVQEGAQQHNGVRMIWYELG